MQKIGDWTKRSESLDEFTVTSDWARQREADIAAAKAKALADEEAARQVMLRLLLAGSGCSPAFPPQLVQSFRLLYGARGRRIVALYKCKASRQDP